MIPGKTVLGCQAQLCWDARRNPFYATIKPEHQLLLHGAPYCLHSDDSCHVLAHLPALSAHLYAPPQPPAAMVICC